MPQKPLHLLVIEDNEADTFLIQRAIRQHAIPADVTICSNGEMAVEFIAGASNRRPHAVILDLSIPRIDGVQVLQQMLSQPELAGVPVMIFTSSPSPRDRQRVENFARVRYVLKPIGVDQFTQTVGENLKSMLLGREA